MTKIKMAFFIERKMLDQLKMLSKITRIKQADYIREGIAIVLKKYKGEFRKSKKKGGE